MGIYWFLWGQNPPCQDVYTPVTAAMCGDVGAVTGDMWGGQLVDTGTSASRNEEMFLCESM